MKEKYEGLNGLRVLAAIAIVFMHTYVNGAYELNRIIGHVIVEMNEMVYLFMAISSFSLCCGYYDKVTQGGFDIETFYGRRYKKILPFFSFLVILDICISFNKEAVIEAAADLTLAFGLLPNADIEVIGVGWFLGVIFVFYFIFPFFCYCIKNKKRAWLGFGISLIYNFICKEYFFDSNHVVAGFRNSSNIIFCAVFFFSGGIIYLYRDKIKANRKALFPLLVVCSIAFPVIYSFADYFFALGRIRSLFLLAIDASWIMLAILINSMGICNKIVGLLSEISFEIYLCHMLFFRILEKTGVVTLLGTNAWAYFCTSTLVLLCAITFSFIFKKLMKSLLAFIDSHTNKVVL